MSDRRDSAMHLWREAGVAYYIGVCLSALGVVYLVLDDRGLDTAWCLAPLLVGLIGIPFAWGKAPIGFLITLGVCVSVGPNRRLLGIHQSGLRLGDLLLCAASLAYVVSHYRLQSLVKEVIPTPPTPSRWRLFGGHKPTEPARAVSRSASKPQRPASLVTPQEIGQFLIWLLPWAMAAQFVSYLLPNDLGNPGRYEQDAAIWQPMWRAVALVWLVGIFVFVVNGVLDYVWRRRMRVDEANMFLQDLLWQETRGEQRRVNRWLAWARLGRPMGFADRIVDLATTMMLSLYVIILAWIVLELYQSLAGG